MLTCEIKLAETRLQPETSVKILVRGFLVWSLNGIDRHSVSAVASAFMGFDMVMDSESLRTRDECEPDRKHRRAAWIRHGARFLRAF